MSTTTGTGRRWGRANRQSLARFAAFWSALQRVGNALEDAEKLVKAADSAGGWKDRQSRHWAIASADEARTALRHCRRSLRVVSMSAKKFEPDLIHREWRR